MGNSAPDFWEWMNDQLEAAPLFTFEEQRHFLIYMKLVRSLSWDIPSALGSICDHPNMCDLFPMHRNEFWPENKENWDQIDHHFEEVHRLDLADPHINWSFDT